MPRYDYRCPANHRFEEYAGFDDDTMLCVCGQTATRIGVYHDQYISCETGPKGGTRSEPPREEKSYRHEFKRFQEAASEIDYAHSRVDDPKVKPPNMWKAGLRQAKKQGAKIRG